MNNGGMVKSQNSISARKENKLWRAVMASILKKKTRHIKIAIPGDF